MKRTRNATYDLKSAAEITGCSREELEQAIRRGDLAVTETDAHGAPRISGIELERWYRSFDAGGRTLFDAPGKKKDAP